VWSLCLIPMHRWAFAKPDTKTKAKDNS